MSPVKIQISLRIWDVLSESSQGAFWLAEGTRFRHTHDEDSG